MKKTLFLAILSNSGVFIIFSIFKSFVAWENEQAASYHEKKRCFGQFSDFGTLYHERWNNVENSV